jgi:hypothetical protein
MFVRWPGVTTAGQQVDEVVTLLDVFPTVLAATDSAAPADLALDGVALGPLLRGEASGPLHERLFWRSGPNRAVRSGDWKLVQAGDHVWLFDLATDVGETTNLAADHPDVVTELLDAFAAWETGLISPAWPSRFERAIMVDGVPYNPRVRHSRPPPCDRSRPCGTLAPGRTRGAAGGRVGRSRVGHPDRFPT